MLWQLEQENTPVLRESLTEKLDNRGIQRGEMEKDRSLQVVVPKTFQEPELINAFLLKTF